MLLDHRFSQRRLPAMLDDDLSARRRRRIQAHADECPECGPVLSELVRLRRVLLGLGRGAEGEGPRAEGVLAYLHSATAMDAHRPGSTT